MARNYNATHNNMNMTPGQVDDSAMGNDSGNYNATRNNMNLTSGSIDDGPLEKDFSNGKMHATDHVKKNLTPRPGYHLDNSMDSDTALRKIRTAGSISISPELFEKIYLSPQNQVKGELRKTFGNPTPLYVYLNTWGPFLVADL